VRSTVIEPVMSITDDGLVLGASCVLAKQKTDASGRRLLAVDGNEKRILALLTAAYGRPIDPAVIDHVRRASLAYSGGETCLALIHLAYAGLPKLHDEKTSSYRLFLAERLLDAGLNPHDLFKICGRYSGAQTVLKAGYDDNEPRIPSGNGRNSGEWTDERPAELVPVAARRPSDEYRTGDPDQYFDTVYASIHSLAERLGVQETWLLGLAAHESGYLNGHNRSSTIPLALRTPAAPM
jgi:hypothetical protein